MISGIGTDLIEIQRVEKAYRKERFRQYCYTKAEQELIGESSSRAAGNFAVKESVAKAFHTGFGPFTLKDIEVLRDEKGCPYVNLYKEARELADAMRISKIHVSITNTKNYAQSFVIMEAEKN